MASPLMLRPGGSLPPRPRQIRLRSTLLLLLSLLVYTWITASRTMLVQHIQVTEAAVVRVTARASRGLREATGVAAVAAGRPLQLAAHLDVSHFGDCRGPRVSEVLPRLVAARQWRSIRARRPEAVTLVTQLSLERLDMLANQCGVWPDAIAAAVYVPTLRGRVWSAQDASLDNVTLEQAVARLGAFHDRMHAEGLCTLDLELATQDFEEEEEAGLYPFNAARNRALMLARTEALLLLDADFVPATSLVGEYQSAEGYAEMLQQLERGQAVVLPAFETAISGEEGKQLAMAAVQRGKDFAVAAYASGHLLGFQVKQYEQGHSPTNYALWVVQDLPYVVKYSKGYEPYVLIARQFVPWYDERFRGYGRDKIQHLTHLAGLNVTFSVHPTAFVVHVPHKKAATFKLTKSTGQWDKLYKLYVEVQKDVKAHSFVPVVSFPQLCSSSSGQKQERRGQQQLQLSQELSPGHMAADDTA